MAEATLATLEATCLAVSVRSNEASYVWAVRMSGVFPPATAMCVGVRPGGCMFAVPAEWARDVAQERGIKYTEMKRGGMLLKNSRNMMNKSGRRLSGVGKKGFSFKDMGSKNDIYGIKSN